nr:LINE-type retrotransposon LIb DNA [Ipomoea batatas]
MSHKRCPIPCALRGAVTPLKFFSSASLKRNEQPPASGVGLDAPRNAPDALVPIRDVTVVRRSRPPLTAFALASSYQGRWWTCFCHFPAGSTATRIRVLRISSEDGARLVIVGITQVIVVIIVINPVPFLALSGAVSPQVLQLCFPERDERPRRLAGEVRLVGEENALVVVVTGGINPGKADELDGAVIGDVFQGEGLEIELAVVIVLDHKRAWDADALVPFECYVTATPPPQVQEKRRFGTWMLVTKKPKSGDTGKNTRNSRKVSNTPSVNHGNQFSLLADINEDSEPTINRQHADKNKSRTAPRQTSKGKHSTPPLNPPPVPPQPRTPLPATSSTPPARVHTQTARNRGGHPATARGRDRELGRVHGLKHDIPHTNSSFSGLMNQPISQNVFQFGGAHPPSSNMTDKHTSLARNTS